MNRRIFVAAGVAAGMGALPAAGRLKIAFLGASHSHARDKVMIARQSARWDLAGISDDDAAVRESYEQAGIRALTRDQILNDSTIRVVTVESDVKRHAMLAKLALDAGKHVHVEKPPADNLEDMRALLDVARRRRLLLQMGYMWRYHPGINAALEAGHKGWLGDIYMVRGVMNTLIGADRRPEWALFHGGQMFEQGGHLIDPMIRLLGKPARITPFLRHHGSYDDGLVDNTVAVFEYPRAMGVIASAVLQPNAGPHRTFEVLGSNGSAVVRPIEPANLDIDLVKAAGPYQKGRQTVKLPPYTRFLDDFEDLADAVTNSRPLRFTPDEDWMVEEALLAASEMLGKGGKG